MRLKGLHRPLYIFTLVFLIVACFIALSLRTIYKVNKIRKDVEDRVLIIGDVSRFESENFKLISNVDQYTDSLIMVKCKTLFESGQELNHHIDLNILQKHTSNLRYPLNRSELVGDLTALKMSCQYAIAENRKQLGVNSEKLSNLWNFTHILLLTSCIMFLILASAIVMIYRSRLREENLKKEY